MQNIKPGNQEGCPPFGHSSLFLYCDALITDEPSRVCDELLPKAAALDCSVMQVLQVLSVLVEVVKSPKLDS